MRITILVASICLFSSMAFGQRQALFLTTATATAPDRAVSNRLESLGFVVTWRSAVASVTADADGKDLIVVSSSVASGDVSTKFTASAVPLINGESAIYDELGIEANNVNGATVAGQTNILLVDCAHPLAAGLSLGAITVLTAAGPVVTLGAIVPSAQVVALVNDGTSRPTIFGIEAGAALNPVRIATAPARRVGFYLEATTLMTADGLKLFDAAVAWATATPVPLNTPIAITGQPANVTANLGATATFTVGLSGSTPHSVQWQRSDGAGGFTNIPGATCLSVTISPVAAADHGAMFQAFVSNAVNSATSSAATLRVPQCLFLTLAGGAAGDTTIQNHLASLGFVVTRVADTASQTSDANGKDLIVVSSSVGSGNISTKFTDSPVPLVNSEQAIYDELGMDANNTGGATVAGQTQIDIVDCTHPLAAGLPTGLTTVYTAAGPIVELGGSGTPVASAQIVARGTDGLPSVFGIEAGAPLNPARIATAPARRVGIFWEASTFMTPDGLKLFDAAVTWAIAAPVPSGTPIGITSQPANTTVPEPLSARFSVGLSGAAPFFIQWQRNDGAGGFTNIPGATCPTFITSPTTAPDNGAMFQAVVSNDVNSALSSVATLTVISDTNPPTMVLAIGAGTPTTTFDLTFSEPVDPNTVIEAGNYELAGGAITAISATLDADGKTVHFVSEPITNGTILTLAPGISVFDLAFVPNALNRGDPGSSIAIITTGGSIRRHVFNIGGGVLVSDLTNNFRFPNFPDVLDFPTLFETPVDAADNYGVQLIGYVTAPVSGNYNFYMSSDDAGVLFLSTDENPANKVLIAREPNWSNSRRWTGLRADGSDPGRGNPPVNISAPIPLVGGQRYFIEALMKEGGGGDNLGVAWQKPGDPVPANGSTPIPGLYLTPYNVPAAIPASQPTNVTTLETRQATFSVTPSGSPFLQLQWYENGVPITDATNASYTTPVLSTADSGKTFFVVLTNDFSAVTSRVATLTVSSDTAGPLLVSVASINGTDIGLCFDEGLDAATAANVANYTVNGGAVSVTSATLRYDGKTVQLTLGGPVTSGFTVAVNNVLDLTGRNAVAPGTSATGNVGGLTPVNIGVPGDPSFGSSFSCRDGEFELIVGGGDVWGNEDHGHFAYEQITGNFDKRVLVARIDPLADSSKGGLMVRESLDANSRNLHAIVMPPPPRRNIFETGTRSATAGPTAGWGIAGGVNGNLPATHPNSWIRLRRIGTIWKGYVSTNGVDWVQNGQSEQLYPDSVFFLLESCANNGNAGPTNRVLFQNLSDTVIPGSSVTITQQPVSATIDANHDVSFRAGASAVGLPASEIGLQWQKSNGAGGFTNINAIGANGATLTVLAAAADNGAQFRVVASVPGASAISTAATLTVTNDVAPPRVVSAVRSCASPDKITIVFEERVEANSATELANYNINDQAIAVSSVALLPDGRTVVVTAGSPIPDGAFNTITVDGVQDLAGNLMPLTRATIRLVGGHTEVNNQIVVEAENFDANTPATDGHFFSFETAPGGNGTFSGAGYMRSFPETGAAINQPAHTPPGASPRLDYCINFPAAGIWRVWVRGADIGGGNSVHIGLDGNSADVTNFRIGNTGGATGWDGTWKWSRDANDSTSTFAAVNVPTAGSHVFNIWMREDRTAVDKILLTRDTAFVFSPLTVFGPNETPVVDITPQARLSITRSGNSVTITSAVPAGVGRLQEADEVTGPWSAVAGADPSNYTVASSAVKKFYRIAVP